MTCYQRNYLHWAYQCCYHCCLPQRYQRSQIWEWIIWQNIHVFTHLLFPIWRRLVRGAESHTSIWSFTISQVTANSVYGRQLIPILKSVMFGGLGKADFSSAKLNHISRCLRQQALLNTEVSKAHSTRSASSSKAEVTGISLTDIIKQGHWSQIFNLSKILKKKYQGIWF